VDGLAGGHAVEEWRNRLPDNASGISVSQLPKLVVAGSRPVSRLANFSVKKPLSADAMVSTKPGQLQFAITVRNGKLTNVREYIDTLALARASEMDA
jgi:ketosteroid isomerase-like protein